MNTSKHRSLTGNFLVAALGAALLFSSSMAQAAEMTFQINATGAQEVNPGDPDGFAIGMITFNNGTGAGNTGFATISLTAGNINFANLTGHHIHNAIAGMNGSIVLDFGNPTSLLVGNMISGTIMNLSATTITNIFANPTSFYYNLHNGDFPGGAVRGQLPVPEPGSVTLLALGAAGLLVVWRRRAARKA